MIHALDDIAETAGVVRRTVHGHFNGRTAPMEGLVEGRRLPDRHPPRPSRPERWRDTCWGFWTA